MTAWCCSVSMRRIGSGLGVCAATDAHRPTISAAAAPAIFQNLRIGSSEIDARGDVLLLGLANFRDTLIALANIGQALFLKLAHILAVGRLQ